MLYETECAMPKAVAPSENLNRPESLGVSNRLGDSPSGSEIARGSTSSAMDASEFAILGQFSNTRYTEEHEYGYSIQLWRTGETLCGLLLVADGSQGDTPTGLLEDLKYDRETGHLSFTNKLSIGLNYVGKGTLKPSHDLFKFDGTLQRNSLTGTLTHYDSLHTDISPQKKRIDLHKLPSDEMIKASTYIEWQQAVQLILNRRGPKW
jgi:hypothetical protein